MRLERLTLTNFGQHESLVVDIPVGITGIVGSNGSGKSTIAHALQFALLGDSGNPGTKADDLNWNASAGGDTGSVELEFVADGTKGKLKRAIHMARASLKCGDINARSVSNVNTEIMKLLGTSKHTLEDIVFVMQGMIEKILFDRPSDRKRNIHALFGIDKTEPIRALLRDEIGSLNLSPIDDRVTNLKSRIETEIDPQLRSVSEQRTQLGAEVEGQDTDALQKIVTEYESAAHLSQHIEKMEAELHRLEIQPAVDVSAIEAQLALKKADVESKAVTIDEMKAKLANLQTQEQTSNTRMALLSELKDLEFTLTVAAPVAPDFDASIIKQLESQIAEAQAEVSSKQAFIDAFEGGGDAVCPTCHQLVTGAGELAESMKPQVAERQQTIDSTRESMEQARNALSVFESDQRSHVSEITRAAQRKTTVEQTLEKIPDVGFINPEAAQVMQTGIDEFNRQSAELTELTQQYNAATQHKTGHEAQVGSLTQSIQRAREQISSQLSADEYERTKLALEFVRNTRVKLAELEGQLKQLQAQRASTLKELGSLEEQAKQLVGLKTYQTLCERSRTVLHYDNLPRLAMQKYLGVLNAKLNQFLVLFHVPFTCAIKNDLSMVCNVPNHGEKPAERLSGGQRVMLGIAFRVAVYNMFASDLGFMVLDEPTNMLDDKRVTCVADMLETVGEYARNAQMQLLVITHEQALVRTFDHTVEL